MLLSSRVSLFGAVLVVAALPLAPDLSAQVASPPSRWQPASLHSGVHGNPTAGEWVVFRDFVTMPANVPWMRLYFTKVWLEKGSYLRMVSVRDGEIMTMRQEHMEQWGYSSAFFNGNSVMVELVAGPNTRKNFVDVEKVLAGDPNAGTPIPETICGATDDRTTSIDNRVGRIDPLGCTGWIINAPTTGIDRVHLSAGHCADPGQVLEFAVPGSAANCAIVHPPVVRQFAIDFANSLWVNGGAGNDWWTFRCFPNPVSGLTTFQTQAGSFGLAAAMPAAPQALEVTGYGLDGTDVNAAPGGNASCGCTPANATGTRNQVQQVHSGPSTAFPASRAEYQVNTCGGNSGSPVINTATGQAVAIHTHGGCANPVAGTWNTGTQVTLAALQAAITAVAGQNRPLDNDECTGALPVVNGTNGTYNNTAATTSTPAFTCGAGVTRDLWFRYVATCTGNTVFDTCTANRNFDTVMEVWSGCGGTLLGCNDDWTGCTLGTPNPIRASQLTVATTQGSTYFIRIGGLGVAGGNFDLVITSCSLANECADAVPLSTGLNGPYTNVGSTTSAPAWPCASGGNDVWFSYQVPGCGSIAVTFTTCDGASYDTAIQAFSGTCGSLVSLGCNNDALGACGLRSSLTVTATGGDTIYVRVGGSASATGTFVLRVSTAPQPPANDACASAATVGIGINGPYCNNGATLATPAFPCGGVGVNADVWFTWTANFTGNAVITTCTPVRNFDTVLQVFTGTCAGLTSVGCNDDLCDGLGSSLTVAVTNTTTYLIRVGGHGGATGTFNLVIGGTATADHCINAVALSLGTNGPYTNVNSTDSLPAWPCGSNTGTDVWFRFTAGATAPYTFGTCTATRTVDTVLEVFSGGCGGLVSLGCNDDQGGTCGLASRVTANLTNGQTCHVRVGSVSSATGNFDVTVAAGTGNGTITTLAHGCGTTVINVAPGANPNIGGSVTVNLTGVAGTAFTGIGFPPHAPYCTVCTVGHGWQSINFGSSRTLNIPLNPIYIGAQVRIQGADFFAPGGCPNSQVRFTDTVHVVVG